MNLDEWAQEVYTTAISKGWGDVKRTAVEDHMLIVTEIAEATEAVRAKKPAIYQARILVEGDTKTCDVTPSDSEWSLEGKPEGEATELADALIRILHRFAQMGWSAEEVVAMKNAYNKTRPYLHGGKAL